MAVATTHPVRDRAAVRGVGWTTYSANSGVSTLALAAEAVLSALDDAGLSVADVDGLATHSIGDSVGPTMLAQVLGMEDLPWHLHQSGGGSISHTIVGQAAMAVASGMATTVVCYRALNARSEMRMGGSGRAPVAYNLEMQYKAPHALMVPAQDYAMAARQHMARYGTTSEHLGMISVAQRDNATRNPRAMLRTPITLDDYFASRWISEPLRLFDCCLESDGACAVVITSADRAADGPHRPVLISGAVWGLGHTLVSNRWTDLTESAAIRTAPRLYSMAGIGPDDVDVAMLYDCFTYSVLVQLEDYGFCAKGEGGPFIASGATRMGGRLPVNTHGGFLSEAYIHGLNHLAEAVLQLRGEAAERQVPGAEVALSTGQGGIVSGETSAVLLRAA